MDELPQLEEGLGFAPDTYYIGVWYVGFKGPMVPQDGIRKPLRGDIVNTAWEDPDDEDLYIIKGRFRLLKKNKPNRSRFFSTEFKEMHREVATEKALSAGTAQLQDIRNVEINGVQPVQDVKTSGFQLLRCYGGEIPDKVDDPPPWFDFKIDEE